MDLRELRREIDGIDDEIVRLFAKRMDIAAEIAEYKKEHSLPILVPAREKEKLADVAEKAGKDMETYTKVLYSTLFELSRSYQSKRTGALSPLCRRISDAMENTPRLFPEGPAVACQGVEGAYSQIAAEHLFKDPKIFYFRNIPAVFEAVEQGLCPYAVVPLENSNAGSAKKVYDLLQSHHFSIVRTYRLKIDHNLLVNPGTNRQDIREIYSHEQAIGQCSEFLSTLPRANVIAVANTAMAARMVSESGRNDVAAISSSLCGELYNLKCVEHSVQDRKNSRTRFLCIGKNLEIFPGSDRTSLMMVLDHKPGALYKVLARIFTLGINVTKVESRPIPDRDFQYMVYFDLETSVYSEGFAQLMGELEELCQEFQYLGSYREVL